MSIQVEIHHPDQIVVAVARGEITFQDLVRALAEFGQSGPFHYRKIFDVTAARPTFTKDEAVGFIEHVRQQRREKPVGLVAFVADPKHHEFAQLFIDMVGSERPTQIFRSIHEARKWLYANSNVKI
jgi:hypothetical protein